jgi:hypothetical protein
MGQPTKGPADYFEPGDWNVACSMCGKKEKASKMVRNWQGLYRHTYHNEPRHPQDFVRSIPDKMGVPFSQPQTDKFVYVCDINRQSAIPAYAGPGCMVPGNKTIDPFGPV